MPTHSVFDGNDKLVFNSAADFYPALGSKEYYRTVGFKEIACIYGGYRKIVSQDGRFAEPCPTPANRRDSVPDSSGIHGEGRLPNHRSVEEKTARCLRENGFDENARPTSVDAKYSEGRPATLEEDAIREAAESLPEQYDVEKILSNPVLFEKPESTVNVSIDDVTVKRQESERPKERAEPREKKRKKARNTVCHVEKGGGELYSERRIDEEGSHVSDRLSFRERIDRKQNTVLYGRTHDSKRGHPESLLLARKRRNHSRLVSSAQEMQGEAEHGSQGKADSKQRFEGTHASFMARSDAGTR